MTDPKLLACGVLLFWASACGPRPGPDGLFPAGTSVPVRLDSAHLIMVDDTRVRTDLYPYRRSEGAESLRYITTGPPLSFVFPRSAYAAYANAEGGPQAKVRLHIDRETMRPIGAMIAETARRQPDWVQRSYRGDGFVDRDLSIDVASNYLGHGFSDSVRGTRNMAARQRRTKVCGFQLWVSPSYLPPPKQRNFVAGVDLMAHDYRGITDAAAPSLVVCTASSSICRISFGFHGREVIYSLPKPQLCDHPRMTGNVRRLLARHRVL